MSNSAPDGSGRARILLVEDDSAVRRSLHLLLSGERYDVRAYRSAVGLAQDPEVLRAACLIADLMMPEKDAVQLLGELRAAGWSGPAILISGHLDDHRTAAAEQAGFAMILSKPIAANLLKKSVAQLIAPHAPAG
jgi:FixJ family two-component response regulator